MLKPFGVTRAADTAKRIASAASGKSASGPKPPRRSSVRVNTSYTPVVPDYVAQKSSWKIRNPPRIKPFFKEKSHTVPTKWSLYRPLIRATYGRARAGSASANEASDMDAGPGLEQDRPTHADLSYLRRKIRQNWKKRRPQTSLVITRNFLSSQYELLATLQRPTVDQLAGLLATEANLARTFGRIDRAAERRAERANRPGPKPRLTGGFIWPSHSNPPLPRLRPQPPHFYRMVRHRLVARERRYAAMREAQEWLQDITAEIRFLRSCGLPDPERDGKWATAIEADLRLYQEGFKRDNKRANQKFSVRDMERILAVRKDRRRSFQEYRRKVNQELKVKKEEESLARQRKDQKKKRKIQVVPSHKQGIPQTEG